MSCLAISGLSLPSDALLHVLCYLSVVDLARVATASRRLCYLVDALQSDVVAPECVARFARPLPPGSSGRGVGDGGGRSGRKRRKVRDDDGDELSERPADVFRRALSGMRSRPNLALTFSAPRPYNEPAGYMEVTRDVRWSAEICLPPDCAVLTTYTLDVQANCEGRVDSGTDFAVMLASFDRERTSFASFYSDFSDTTATATERVEAVAFRLRAATPRGADLRTHWKVVFMFSTEDDEDDDGVGEFISALQSLLPEASIIGGVCDRGDVRLDLTRPRARPSVGGRRLRSSSRREREVTTNEITFVADGIIGLALGGDVPIHSVVSRGHRSLTSGSISFGSSDWVVSDAGMSEADDASNYRDAPVHFLREVRNIKTGERLQCRQWFERVRSTEREGDVFCGLKRRGNGGGEEGGFNIHEFTLLYDSSIEICEEVVADMGELNNHVGSQIDLFEIDGPACLEDMDMTLACLRDRIRGKRVLGAIMISCNGRGPERDSLLDEEMADAMRFSQRFPDAPCVGFYAAGEIGSRAMAWDRDVLRRGRAALQAYTAVFALLIAPDDKNEKHDIDDGPAAVMQYMRQRTQR